MKNMFGLTRVLRFLSLIVLCVLGSEASAGMCTGSGCGAIQIRKENNCIVYQNTSGSVIIMTAYGGGLPRARIYSQSTYTPKTAGGKCLEEFDYDYTADIEGALAYWDQCFGAMDIRALGYSSGHKTEYCRAQGFDGNTGTVCIRTCPSTCVKAPIKKLGWESGHKTRFCILRGYDGVHNIGDYGNGGFCFRDPACAN